MPGNNANKADEFVVAYDRYCRQIDKEDDLVDQRIRWLLMSQSLLFAAAGLAGDSDSVVLLKLVIPWVGFWSSLFIMLTVWAASASLIRYRWLLSGIWKSFHPNGDPEDDKVRYPQLKRFNLVIAGGLIPGMLIPLIFCAVWSLLYRGY